MPFVCHVALIVGRATICLPGIKVPLYLPGKKVTVSEPLGLVDRYKGNTPKG